MSKHRRRTKSAKQLEREEYKYYSCDNCMWSVISADWCRKFDCSIALVHCCKQFEVKSPNRDCTQCVHYNCRKNARQYCKIGIYNCRGVVHGNIN